MPEAEARALLARKELLIAFATAPTGLGHLRVTQALREGLPPEAAPVLLGAEDHVLDLLHRVTSLDPRARAMFEWIQSGTAEDVVTAISRRLLRTTAPLLKGELVRLATQRLDRPEVVLAVATHFGLAHQLVSLKERLWTERKIRLAVAVQVTDDSPQHIWLVPGADLIVVPSENTRRALLEYASELQLSPPPPIAVAPYPVSPALASMLSEPSSQWRAAQLDPGSKEPIHVAVPISGAAVGLGYLLRLMDYLHRYSDRFLFDVVSRNNPYTLPFLNGVIRRPYARAQASGDDRDVVHAYERVYQHAVIALEVTKPSEQAFKALLGPELRGGALLLLAQPVGRQEYDNIDFLRRHALLPQESEQDLLWRLARERQPLEGGERARVFDAARGWRAMRLPANAAAASRFITWCLEERLLLQLVDWRNPSPDASEVSPYGVREFWSAVSAAVAPLFATAP